MTTRQPKKPPPSAPPDSNADLVTRAAFGAPGCLLGVIAGAGAGGLSGAIARGMVAVWFIYAVDAGGGSFFGGSVSTGRGLFAVISEYRALIFTSAAIGFVVCGLAGASCRIYIAAPVGAVLSAGPCFVLAVFPSVFLMSMSGGNNEPDLQAVWSGLIGMIIAGALAGTLGAVAGKYAMRAMWRAARPHGPI